MTSSEADDALEVEIKEYLSSFWPQTQLESLQEDLKYSAVVRDAFDKKLPDYVSLTVPDINNLKLKVSFNLDLQSSIDFKAFEEAQAVVAFPKKELIEKLEKSASIEGLFNDYSDLVFRFSTDENILPNTFKENAELYNNMTAADVLANTLKAILKIGYIHVDTGHEGYIELRAGLGEFLDHIRQGKMEDIAKCCERTLGDYWGFLASRKDPSKVTQFFAPSARKARDKYIEKVNNEVIKPAIKLYGLDKG